MKKGFVLKDSSDRIFVVEIVGKSFWNSDFKRDDAEYTFTNDAEKTILNNYFNTCRVMKLDHGWLRSRPTFSVEYACKAAGYSNFVSALAVCYLDRNVIIHMGNEIFFFDADGSIWIYHTETNLLRNYCYGMDEVVRAYAPKWTFENLEQL